MHYEVQNTVYTVMHDDAWLHQLVASVSVYQSFNVDCVGWDIFERGLDVTAM